MSTEPVDTDRTWYEIQCATPGTNNWWTVPLRYVSERPTQSDAEASALKRAQKDTDHDWRVVEVRRTVKVCRVYTTGACAGAKGGEGENL